MYFHLYDECNLYFIILAGCNTTMEVVYIYTVSSTSRGSWCTNYRRRSVYVLVSFRQSVPLPSSHPSLPECTDFRHFLGAQNQYASHIAYTPTSNRHSCAYGKMVASWARRGPTLPPTAKALPHMEWTQTRPANCLSFQSVGEIINHERFHWTTQSSGVIRGHYIKERVLRTSTI
jgi:hypothetical protein